MIQSSIMSSVSEGLDSLRIANQHEDHAFGTGYGSGKRARDMDIRADAYRRRTHRPGGVESIGAAEPVHRGCA